MIQERERLEAALRSLKLQVGVLNPIEGHSVRVYPVRLGRVKGDQLLQQLPEVAGRMGVKHVRGAFISGSSRFGIEIPRQDPKPLGYREVYPLRSKALLPLALGRDVYGKLKVMDLARAPHLLIGGGTGSGKSTAINGFLCGLLQRLSPLQLRVVLIDPKRVELAAFAAAPHAIQGSISEANQAVRMLEALGTHMDKRYALLEQAGCRELVSYNQWARQEKEALLPRIVVVVDELADLMLSSKGRCEKALVRLAQKARAVGIHLILATQQPKSDIVTSLIKVNIPARLAFSVGNHHESRAILDSSGAENLLGRGDGLFVDRESGSSRIQSPLITDEDIQQTLQQLKRPYVGLRAHLFGQKDGTGNADSSKADAFLARFPELAAPTPPTHAAHAGHAAPLAQPTVTSYSPTLHSPALHASSPNALASNTITSNAVASSVPAPNAVIHNPDDTINQAIALAKARGKLTGIMLVEEKICSRSQSKNLMNRLRALGIIGKHDRSLGYSPLTITHP